MWDAETRIVAARRQVSCDLGGETAILHLTSGIYYGLDPVGSRVWQWIQQPRTLSELERLLLSEYQVAPATAAADLRELCDNLQRAGLLDQP